MSDVLTFTCPECHGHPEGQRHVRIKRADGDYLEWQLNICGLCQGEGKVTLDQIYERATDPVQYFEQIVEMGKPHASSSGDVPDDSVNNIPF